MKEPSLKVSEEELGANEALVRDVNETVAEVAEMRGPEESVEVLCECADTFCAESITLTCVEYEGVRAVSDHFLVKPGHVLPDIERVVERHADYWIIEKLGEAGELAEETDPRSPG